MVADLLFVLIAKGWSHRAVEAIADRFRSLATRSYTATMRVLSQIAEALRTHPDEWPVERKSAFACGLAIVVFCVCVGFILWYGVP